MRTAIALVLMTATAAAAPAPTFRWAAAGLGCQTSFDERSADDRCTVTQNTAKAFTVVGFAPTAADARIQVTRYAGDHAGAPHVWTAYTDLGAKAVHPIVLVKDQVVFVAAVSDGVAQIASLDVATGKALHTLTVLDHGAAEIQLEAPANELHAFVLRGDGSGRTTVIAPATLAVTQTGDVPAAAIRMTMSKTAQSADYARDAKLGTQNVEARWDGPALVVRSGGWSTKLIDDDRFRMQVATLHVTADRVLATVHHEMASGTQVYGLDAKTGARVWAIGVTGIGPIAHSKYHNAVSALTAGDLLVVQGVESAGVYVCTVAVADGRELACVDHLAAAAVVTPDPPKVKVAVLPPKHPLGPQTKSSSCKKSKHPGASLEQNGIVDDMWRAKIVAPSSSCKALLGGGIAGDRIEIEVWDHGDKPGDPVCECTFTFEQEVRPESKTVIVKIRGGGSIANEPLVRK